MDTDTVKQGFAQDKTNPEKITAIVPNILPAPIRLEIPRLDRPISEFCIDLANKLDAFYKLNWNKTKIIPHNANTFCGEANDIKKRTSIGCLWCVKNGLIGRIVPIEVASSQLERVVFRPFKPEEFVTAIEEHFKVIKVVFNEMKNRTEELRTSITTAQAKVILSSDALRKALPVVDKLFVYSIPLLTGTKPRSGQDKDKKPQTTTFQELIMAPEGFNSYVDPSGETVHFYCHNYWEKTVKLDDAIDLLNRVYKEFRFKDGLDKIHAIAHLLTPFCQPLMGWRKKAPIWMFTADQARSGKDYLAMISPIIHEGVAVQDPPLEEESEMKRRITSAIVSGRRFQHLANCRGDLDSPSLEAAITSEFWADRLIGTSEAPVMVNEIIFSMSYNEELDITPDLRSRSRRVHLKESNNPNNKTVFKTKNLHSLLYSWEPLDKSLPLPICRENVLAALLALVQNWVTKGCPDGNTFTSFIEWADKVGGIMVAAGLGDPTTIPTTDWLIADKYANAFLRLAGWFIISGNNEEDKKKKAELASGLTSGEIFQIMEAADCMFPGSQLFSPIIVFGKEPKTAFGKALAKMAKQGPRNNAPFKVTCVSTATTRKKYIFEFKDANFLKDNVDFDGVFDIPAQSPLDFLKEREPESPQTPHELEHAPVEPAPVEPASV